MASIREFIVHAVNNFVPLNEYAQKIVDQLVKQYMGQAEEYGYDDVDEDDIRKYITRFDKIKYSLKDKDKELFKQEGADYVALIELPKLMQLVTTAPDIELDNSKQKEIPEDERPMEVYASPDRKIIIYKGDKEKNCVRFKAEQAPSIPWCIASSSYSNYRYDQVKGYPVFYLAKNENLPSTDDTSVVAIQVKSPKLRTTNKRYRWTNRRNSPHESSDMSWEELVSNIPWLTEIPNVKEVLKYVPLSSEEEEAQGADKIGITYQEWSELPFKRKQRYLIARSAGYNSSLFTNVSNDNFGTKFLPKYPELALNAAQRINDSRPMVSSDIMMSAYDKFDNNTKKSLISNLLARGKKISTAYLSNHDFPFEAVKDITNRNGWDNESKDTYYFVTKDGDAIVGIVQESDNNLSLSIYTDTTAKENIKLSDRTAKFIKSSANLDKLPISILNSLIANNQLTTKEAFNKLKETPPEKSSVATKEIGDSDYVFDSRSLNVYKVTDNGFLDASSEEFEEDPFAKEKEDPYLQKRAIDTFNYLAKNRRNFPKQINYKNAIDVASKLPYDQRVWDKRGENRPQDTSVLLFANGLPFYVPKDINLYDNARDLIISDDMWDDRGRRDGSRLNDAQLRAYQRYAEETNQALSGESLKRTLDRLGDNDYVKLFLKLNLPLAQDNPYKFFEKDGRVFLINKQDPTENYYVNPNTGNLINGRMSGTKAQQVLNSLEPMPASQAQLRQRIAQRQAQEPVEEPPQAAAGEAPQAVAITPGPHTGEEVFAIFTRLNLPFGRLPATVQRRIFGQGAVIVSATGDRGAETRNQLLTARGRVTAVARLEGRSSAIYFIRMASGTVIATIAMQPGNYQLLATPGAVYQLGSVTNLSNVLQMHNITEEEKGICVREFLAENPSMVDEVKQHLKHYIKTREMKTPNTTQVLKEVLKRLVKENQPAPAPSKPDTKPTTAPGKPGTDRPKPRRPLGNPDVKPKPKAVMSEEEVVDKIVKRFKSKK